MPPELGTAEQLATMRVPIAAPHETVSAVLDRMRGETYDSAAVLAVCDGDRLVGAATLERLLASPSKARVGDVMDPRPPTVTPGISQERVAWVAVHRAEPGVAVVDEAGRFRGLIPPHRLLAVLTEEHDEDMARLGGFLHSAKAARTASTETVARRLWHHTPWL